ncbi:hypothetical protein L9F63_001755, partial [Diploptera punctata]
AVIQEIVFVLHNLGLDMRPARDIGLSLGNWWNYLSLIQYIADKYSFQENIREHKMFLNEFYVAKQHAEEHSVNFPRNTQRVVDFGNEKDLISRF